MATLQGYITQLIAHLNTHADFDFVAFKTALRAKTQHVRAAFRYYFFVGLALLVDEVNNHYFYTLDTPPGPPGTPILQDEAIRSFMRAQWQGTLPSPNNIAGSTFVTQNSRGISLLYDTNNVGSNVAGNVGINPYEEFSNHLVTENGSL